MEDVRLALAELPTRADREPVVGAGEGGDETSAIDAAARRLFSPSVGFRGTISPSPPRPTSISFAADG